MQKSVIWHNTLFITAHRSCALETSASRANFRLRPMNRVKIDLIVRMLGCHLAKLFMPHLQVHQLESSC